MPEAFDLSSLKDKKPSGDPSYDGLTPEEQASVDALGEKTEPEQPEAHAVVTAFLVIMETDGSIHAEADLDTPLARQRLPHGDDVYAACSVVMRDVEASHTSQVTLVHLQNMTAQMQQQMANQQMAQRLEGMNLRG